ncbi:MAG: hypothetical protein E6I60_12265 [Chloroflexi bacterium]|nr:MAG: hypothetical protein E6I60_12265 [Chloroflexota bacterium]
MSVIRARSTQSTAPFIGQNATSVRLSASTRNESPPAEFEPPATKPSHASVWPAVRCSTRSLLPSNANLAMVVPTT